MQVSINGSPLSPRQRLIAVPYALVAETVQGGSLYVNPTSGNVGIGTTIPSVLLQINNGVNDPGSGGEIGFGSTAPGPMATIGGGLVNNPGGSARGELVFKTRPDIGPNPILTQRMRITHEGRVGLGTANPQMLLQLNDGGGVFGTGGEIGFGSATPSQDGATAIPMASIAGSLEISSGGVNQGHLVFKTRPVGPPGQILTERMRITANGFVGIGTDTPAHALDVNGTARVKIVQITGGSDVAEPFDVTDAASVPRGAVLTIDEKNPGRLKLSGRSYDTRVAGIVSGAGGVNPGLVLSQEGVMDGAVNVALSGRVYVLADATEHPIQPGDLLTTSPTPGHAMKVTDFSRAHGAVIGKAMSGLHEGLGLVLVLVNLQ